MTIRWEIYDALFTFKLGNAACLWLEIQPTFEIEEDVPRYIHDMGVKIILGASQVIYGFPYEVNLAHDIQRSELKQIAEYYNEKPKFLYPEMRKPEGIHPNREKKLLLIIKALLSAAKIENNRQTVGKIRAALQSIGESIDDKTIRTILDEIPNSENGKS